MREPREKDYNVLYPETGEDRILRTEQEKACAEGRCKPLGATVVVSTKVRGAFKAKQASVKRMRTFKVDVNSKVWKDYLAKKISFMEVKRLCRIA
jgi:hypothetical protein